MDEIVIINCAECGREIVRSTPKHKYCGECACIRMRRAAKAANERKRDALRAEKKAAAEAEAQKDVLHVLTLAGKTANRITAEARAFGMTYGTYSAAVRDGSIDKILKAKGFADPEAILREVTIK